MSTTTITQFYTCFQRKDYRGMQACYHPDIEFSDSMFPLLKGKKAKAMWHMLLSSGADLTVTFTNVLANEKEGSCHWEAAYTFSLTGRKVLNKIDARFQFKDGLIIRHQDSFDFWRWSRMAMGPTGFFLGWLPPFKQKVRNNVGQRLEKFIEKNPEYL